MVSVFSWLKSERGPLTQADARTLRERLRERAYRQSNTYRILKRLEAARERASSKTVDGDARVGWLLPFRDDLRSVFTDFRPSCNEGQVGVLRRYMATCPPEMLPLCIWLLGKCADRFRLYGLAGFCFDPSPQIRRHVAKALRRMEAWSQLERMTKAFPDDERIHWFATTPPTHRPFKERLTNFVQTVDDSHAGEVATPSRMPYWALENSWGYTPPKSVLLIRHMLRRIRHLVRWGVGSS